MAESEYKRLGCVAVGCENPHKAKGLCSTHYRRLQRHGSHDPLYGTCKRCGCEFQKSKSTAIYCSNACKLADWKGMNPDRCAELNEPKVTGIYAGFCAGCGKAFVSRQKRKYCKDSCRPRCEQPPFVLGKHYTPPVRTCRCCGFQWSAICRVGPTAFCPTPECQVAKKHCLKRVASKSHVKRAKSHGRRYGYFNVLRVFARDQWRCQICGKKTPKALRGKSVPDAPELGHIVALADGGDHVIENCQCECRACNAAKGTRALGQLWLAGFADIRGGAA